MSLFLTFAGRRLNRIRKTFGIILCTAVPFWLLGSKSTSLPRSPTKKTRAGQLAPSLAHQLWSSSSVSCAKSSCVKRPKLDVCNYLFVANWIQTVDRKINQLNVIRPSCTQFPLLPLSQQLPPGQQGLIRLFSTTLPTTELVTANLHSWVCGCVRMANEAVAYSVSSWHLFFLPSPPRTARFVVADSLCLPIRLNTSQLCHSTVPAVGKEHSTPAFVSIPKTCFLYLGQVEYVEWFHNALTQRTPRLQSCNRLNRPSFVTDYIRGNWASSSSARRRRADTRFSSWVRWVCAFTWGVAKHLM